MKKGILAAVVLATILMIGCECNYSGGKKEKPVLYVYPEKNNTEVQLSLDYDGSLTTVYPAFTKENCWEFTADKDGTITMGDREYNYLFWEGEDNRKTKIDIGYCVAKEDLVPFLEKELSELGLNDKEMDDFITYWLPRLSQNKYNLISFDSREYVDVAKLQIKPAPDTLIRVFMTYKGVDKQTEITAPDKVRTPERKGFTIVEWGGSMLY